MINGITQFAATQLAQTNGGATTSSYGHKSISNIADLLQRTEGNSIEGALATQLNPAGQNVSVINPNALEAAALSPSITLTSNTSLQVADFVNTTQDAFPTSAPTPAPTAPPDNGSSNVTNTDTDTNTNSNPAPAPDDTGSSDFNANLAYQSAPIGIYNSVASASASIIRGSSLNTTA
jgi:hypothetical protein